MHVFCRHAYVFFAVLFMFACLPCLCLFALTFMFACHAFVYLFLLCLCLLYLFATMLVCLLAMLVVFAWILRAMLVDFFDYEYLCCHHACVFCLPCCVFDCNACHTYVFACFQCLRLLVPACHACWLDLAFHCLIASLKGAFPRFFRFLFWIFYISNYWNSYHSFELNLEYPNVAIS